jgi:hypothetical protein
MKKTPLRRHLFTSVVNGQFAATITEQPWRPISSVTPSPGFRESEKIDAKIKNESKKPLSKSKPESPAETPHVRIRTTESCAHCVKHGRSNQSRTESNFK